jgi:integrase
MDTATQLLPINGLRPVSLRHLIGLLAATGMRPSEALRLTRADVDLVDGLITIRATKFHKSRQIPLHASTTEALQSYCALAPQFGI